MATKILYVHGIEAIGGAERDLIALLKGLDRQKWEPHVVCPGMARSENSSTRLQFRLMR
ncbi:MAG TPA: hypothetical protein VLL06_07120 [Nitrospiraceae bacterium]|nr:hypothetical protein [Nitrospiraceae bacterium]